MDSESILTGRWNLPYTLAHIFIVIVYWDLISCDFWMEFVTVIKDAQIESETSNGEFWNIIRKSGWLFKVKLKTKRGDLGV